MFINLYNSVESLPLSYEEEATLQEVIMNIEGVFPCKEQNSVLWERNYRDGEEKENTVNSQESVMNHEEEVIINNGHS